MKPLRPEPGGHCLRIGAVLVVIAAPLALIHLGLASDSPASTPRLRPAMLVWSVGLDQPGGPSSLLETITAATWNGRRVWRVTHYPQDPSASRRNDFDLYDLDRDTLAPLRSLSIQETGSLALEFEDRRVTVRTIRPDSGPAGETVEEVELHGAVSPEGPGLTPFVATLPLGLGYVRRYEMVDRWDGSGNARLKTITLRVTRRGGSTSTLGRNEIFEVAIRPGDGSFSIQEEVLAQGLHWPLRMTYGRGSSTLRSEVVAIAVSP